MSNGCVLSQIREAGSHRSLEDTHTDETDASLERDFFVVVGGKK
jgi:hypothetical protein